MCIAIWKPENITLFEETLKNCWDANSDGAGFMYPENGKVVIVKGLMTFKDFMDAYEPHKAKACVLHFRISTHGKTNAANTHPFAVSDTLGLVHNGIINNIKCDIDKDMSDTWHFVEKVSKPFQHMWQHPAYKALTELFIGYSKLIMLDGDGNVEIFNEQSGNWNSGCWFSNRTWETRSTKQENTVWSREKLELGDTCITCWDESAIGHSGLKIPKGSTVRVESFGQGPWVWVVCLDLGMFEGMRCKISSFGLEKTSFCCLVEDFKVDQEVVFKENYNHFRIGERGLVTSVAKDTILVKELTTSNPKNYLVPKTKVSPAVILLN